MKSVFDIDRAKPRAFTSDMGFWPIGDAAMCYSGIDYGHAHPSEVRVVVASTPTDNTFRDLILAYVDHVREEAARAADYDRALLLGSVRRRPWVLLAGGTR